MITAAFDLTLIKIANYLKNVQQFLKGVWRNYNNSSYLAYLMKILTNKKVLVNKLKKQKSYDKRGRVNIHMRLKHPPNCPLEARGMRR